VIYRVVTAGHGHGVGSGGGGDAVVEGVAVGIDSLEVIVGIRVLGAEVAREQGKKNRKQNHGGAKNAGLENVLFHNSDIFRMRKRLW